MLARCLLFSLSVMASAAHADPVVHRTPSHLDVHLDTPPRDGWELKTASGHFCARGGNEATISLDKIASDEDLTLELGNGGVVKIPALRKLSALPKPEHDAVIYQVPVRTYFARGTGKAQTGRLEHFTDAVLHDIKDMGVDYLWMTGLLEALSPDNSDVDVVKGDAGSYYAVTDNWDINPQVGTLDDFDAFVDRAHAAGLRVLMDLVVNHTARVHRTDVACKGDLDFGKGDDVTEFFANGNNYFHLNGTTFEPPAPGSRPGDGRFDTDIFTPGFQPESPALVTGNNVTSSQPRTSDWFETVKLNYGYDFTTGRTEYTPRPRTWDQMVDVARYWVEKGADGFRIDVAHAVPVEFYRYLATELRRVNPAVFFVAEAYESDTALRSPGFSYDELFNAGIDTVFNKDFYDRLREQGSSPGRFYGARLADSPALRPSILSAGRVFTNFLENHDEIRVASRYFSSTIGTREQRANMGYALSSFAALLPAHFLFQGGQELGEDANIVGAFGGDNGRTSIFDFIYQSETRKWLQGERAGFANDLRNRYKAMLQLKKQAPFNLAHTAAAPSFADLHEANWTSPQSYWIGSFVRWARGEAYLVVTNSDPINGHEATIHFTYTKDADPIGTLGALGIANSGGRWRFTEGLGRAGWQPRDPNVQGDGMPGWVLYQTSGVPSGLFLGEIPPATTYVFKVEKI